MTPEEIPARLATSINAFKAYAEEYALDTLEWINGYADDLCDSEIEKIFFLAYAFLQEGPDNFDPDIPSATTFRIGERGTLFDVTATMRDVVQHRAMECNEISCQVPIGKYRADFLIGRAVRDFNGETRGCSIVVECDGHDFHERTKEQAQRDKERDRFLQSQGYAVLRFTGSEVYRNPAKCAKEVHDYLAEQMNKFYRESRQKPKPPAVEDPFGVTQH